MKIIDINIYGPVVDSSWWNEGVVTPKQVQDALKIASNGDQVNVHINSPGGSVFAGQAIHNMIKQHPANVTVYIDGLAASIASVIAMAGNKIVMPPGTMMMIHNPLVSMYGAYEASEMRETADFLDKIKESLVATYMSRKTNKTKEDIIALMDATTWLTAEDSVIAGFADEVQSVAAVNSSISGKVLNIAGMNFNLESFSSLPVNIITKAPEKKEENILDLKELQAKHPDIFNEVVNIGISQERTRMKALDEVQITGFEDIVNRARYESGATAEQVAIQIITAQKKQGSNYLENREKDVANAKVNEVPGAPASENEAKATEEKEVEGVLSRLANMVKDGEI